MNHTSPETLSYITLCTHVCPYIYLLKFLLNNLFSWCFEITITPRGWRTTCGQSHPWCGQLAPRAAGCVIFRPMDWWSRSGTVHRKYTGLPKRIDRNEYYFALLYIVRQVTIPYSAQRFWRNSPVLWCFEISRMPGSVSRMRADPDVLVVVNTSHRCDSQRISIFRCENYRSQYRLSI